jgi:hypothetical protein
MLVSDPRFAAQLVDASGRRRFFDDIGCLDAHLAEHPSETPRGLWVRLGESWVDARSARYFSDAASPMDYGFVAGERGPLDFSSVRAKAAARRQEHSR